MESRGNTAVDAALGELDEAQRRAATTLEGPVRIVAGAGAGKTRTITRRIAHACAVGAWDPARTLAVTFSRKAAAEMRSRLTALGVGQEVTAETFHSAALHQLWRVWDDVSDTEPPRVAEDMGTTVERALRFATGSSDWDAAAVRAVQAEVNWTKVQLVAPQDYARVVAATHREPPAGLDAGRFADVLVNYEREKSAYGRIDFNDILLVMCHVMEDFEDAAARVRRSIGWLTVDEYQDVSPLQHRLLRLWLGHGDGGAGGGAGRPNANVCVVGDPAQTIYSFAGATSYYLTAFADEFAPIAADIDLAVDYRSTPQVVDYANRVLAASPERGDYLRLRSARASGTRITRTVYGSDQEEAAGVAARIARGVGKGMSPGDFAVLTRINAQGPAFVAALRREGLRCRVRRDAGWSGAALAPDQDAAKALEDRLGGQAPEGEVTISTIHAAKGLEFRHVFLVGLSEGLLPYGSPAPGAALEEERRLLYVGVTRAEDSLHLSYARTKDGSGAGRRISRFLG